MSTQALVYLYRALVMLIAIPFHEAAHAYVSWRLGDSTARDNGRLTLNPLAHFDLFGAICMIVAGVGWAKPVPTRPGLFRDPKKGMALTALAGPAANLVLAYVSMILYKMLNYFVPASAVTQYVILFFYYMVIINVTLAVFNMLPVPPFDGSRILLVVLPRRLYFRIMQYERYLFLAVFVALMMGLLDTPLYYLRQAALTVLDYGTIYVDLYALSWRLF